MSRRAILKSLRAAGLSGKTFRPVADIEADLAKTVEAMWRLRRERKAAMASIRLKERHKTDVEFTKKLRAGRAESFKDPVKFKQWQEKIHSACLERGWYLPPMTAEQRTAYNRMLRKGVPRDQALPVALR